MLVPELFGRSGKESSTPSVQSEFSYVPPASSEPASQSPGEMFAVEDLRGKSYYDVKDKSFNGGMKLVVEYKQYSSEARGTILSQEPAAESMAAYGTEIRIVISAGPEERTIPNLAGWKMEHAKAYLEEMGFKVEVMMVQISDYPKGYVQETSPLAGENRKEGDTIILRVSDVETTTPPPTTTTAPTDSGSGGGWWGDLFG